MENLIILIDIKKKHKKQGYLVKGVDIQGFISTFHTFKNLTNYISRDLLYKITYKEIVHESYIPVTNIIENIEYLGNFTNTKVDKLFNYIRAWSHKQGLTELVFNHGNYHTNMVTMPYNVKRLPTSK